MTKMSEAINEEPTTDTSADIKIEDEGVENKQNHKFMNEESSLGSNNNNNNSQDYDGNKLHVNNDDNDASSSTTNNVNKDQDDHDMKQINSDIDNNDDNAVVDDNKFLEKNSRPVISESLHTQSRLKGVASDDTAKYDNTSAILLDDDDDDDDDELDDEYFNEDHHTDNNHENENDDSDDTMENEVIFVEDQDEETHETTISDTNKVKNDKVTINEPSASSPSTSGDPVVENVIMTDETPLKSNTTKNEGAASTTNPNTGSNRNEIKSASTSKTSQQQPINLLNRFASWKSKADAVIQSSEILKSAQKNIEDKTKEMQKAVETNFASVNGRGNSDLKEVTTMGNNDHAFGRKNDDNHSLDSEDNLGNNTSKSNTDKDGKKSSGTGRKGDYYDDDQSKRSRLTLESDDVSYESRVTSHRGGDSLSEGSSIYVSDDDGYSTCSSDQSSIRVRSPIIKSKSGGAGQRSTDSSPERSPPSKSTTSTKSQSPPQRWIAKPRNLFQQQNQQEIRNNRSTDSTGDVASSISRGRYTSSISQPSSRPALLKHLSSRIRAPSPPPILKASPSSSSMISSRRQQQQQSNSNSMQHHLQKQSTAIEKQISRIHKSSTFGPQAESILSNLLKGEYPMLLGPGMLGVNLKQTFLKGNGVYVDLIVPGGNAQKSGVVCIGDSLVKVGDADVSKGTIYEVPGIIAKSKRPLLMILNGEKNVNWEEMDNVSVALGMVNRIQEDANQGISQLPIKNPSDHGRSVLKNDSYTSENDASAAKLRMSKSNLLDAENDQDADNHDGENQKIESNSEQNDTSQMEQKSVVLSSAEKKLLPHLAENQTPSKKKTSFRVQAYHRQNSHMLVPPSPSKTVRKSLEAFAAKRSNQIASYSALNLACQHNLQFRDTLREAFMTCCIDSRRLPFFAAYISNEDSLLSADGEHAAIHEKGKIAGSTLLMLFLEIISFRELFHLTPSQRRLFAAERIAYKFLIPRPQKNSVSTEGSKDLEGPLFDMRAMFSSDIINAVQNSLNEAEQTPISHYLFGAVENCLTNALSGKKFVSFLLSDECARMRAYVKGTSPYLDPVLDSLFEESMQSESKNFHSACNHLEFIIVYLLCQHENDVLDKNYDKNKHSSDNDNKRVTGASGGICCAMYIKRVLTPSLKKAKDMILQNKSAEDMSKTLINSFETFWECFIAPSGGMLDFSPLSNDTQVILDKVRRYVLLAASPPKNFSVDERRRHIVRSLSLNTDLEKSLNCLKEELIYDYSVNSHPKYRGHTIHEWMCAEVNKAAHNFSNDAESASESETIQPMSIPVLPSGSISRLFRRLELPDGLSRHRPIRSVVRTPVEPPQSDPLNCNADFAIVFGTKASSRTATDSVTPNALSSLMQSNLRRYACVPLSKEAKENSDGLDVHEMLPATLESYAFVPLQRKRQFGHLMDSSRFTMDGFEVSLIDFIMPCNMNSDNPSDDGHLYGVSLVINSSTDLATDELTIELVNEKGDGNQQLENKILWSQENGKIKISISVDAEVHKFNELLCKIKPCPKVEREEDSVPNKSFHTVGIIFVAYQNVIPAMRISLGRFFSKISGVGSSSSQGVATPLANILNVFQNDEASKSVLASLVKPYIQPHTSSKLMSPNYQKELYEVSAMEALVESLPPIPLALLFITALLEQKIVFASRRRSCLISTAVALKRLLRPFKWTHLFVPLVPAALANDLVQYPAPFILGIPTDTVGSIGLLKSIPDDVTLVDLDVGRVILSKNISTDFDIQLSHEEERASATALRSQMLHLAETLGNVLGSDESSILWKCDSPVVDSVCTKPISTRIKAEAVQNAIHLFLKELLTGFNTCCFWIEEATTQEHGNIDKECNVLFDEDRFFELKRLRSDGNYQPLFHNDDFIYSNSSSRDEQDEDSQYEIYKLDSDNSYSLNLDHFNLIIETFLRGQAMSCYLSSRKKETMSFC